METMVLSLKRKSIKVSLENEDGTVEELTLQEITGAQRDQYLTAMAKRMKFDENGKPQGVSDFTGLHSQLLSLALIDASGKQIPETRIQTWRSQVIQDLFKAAQKMNGMDEEGRTDAKNV